MFVRGLIRFLLLGILLSLATGCDSAEERAAKHYKSAMELVSQGDLDRAMVELRNVLSLDESNHDARLEYAKIAAEKGNIADSYANYLRVAEQYPDDMEAQLALTRMAILAQNWDEAKRHGDVLAGSDVKLEGKDAALLALKFRQAALDKDDAKLRQLTREAEAMAQTDASDAILQRILIEGYTRDGNFDAALAVLDKAIAQTPNNQGLYMIKASILNQTGNLDALETVLRQAIDRFPSDDKMKAALIRLLVARGDLDQAETFLRDQVAKSDKPEATETALLAFLRQVRGSGAAMKEADAAVAKFPDSVTLRSVQAGLLFDAGNRDQAIANLQDIIDKNPTSDQINALKVVLAKMLAQTGNEVGARKLVEEVLAADATNVEAMKMSAEWLIRDDKVDDAIALLRRVLDQSPQDAGAMTLMAQAHDRNGNHDLAMDLYSLAVEASNNGAPESLRYAGLLYKEKRYRPAEDVLVAALKARPGDIQLLRLLGDVFVGDEDWARATQVETTLRDKKTDSAVRLADALRLKILSQKDGSEAATAYLEQLAQGADPGAAAKIGLIRANIADGKTDEALGIAKEIVAEHPDNVAAQKVLGSTYMAARDFVSAEAAFRGILKANPKDQGAWTLLVRALSSDGRRDDAQAAVDDALAANPDSPVLLWAKAGFLEKANDIDGALAIYEDLYKRNSNSLVVANNLASILATYHDDAESLDRAFAVAKRLKESKVPAFQETYGWIQFRRGNFDEAVQYIEPAAAALKSDPIVQYHLGKALLAVDRKADALAAFRDAVQLAGEADQRSQIADARKEVTALADANAKN